MVNRIVVDIAFVQNRRGQLRENRLLNQTLLFGRISMRLFCLKNIILTANKRAPDISLHSGKRASS